MTKDKKIPDMFSSRGKNERFFVVIFHVVHLFLPHLFLPVSFISVIFDSNL